MNEREKLGKRINKPMKVTKEQVFKFLDRLREEGITNMFGAVPYIRGVFDVLTEEEAKEFLVEWMKTFSERHK